MERNYVEDILNLLLDQYERRGLYRHNKGVRPRAVALNVAEAFPEYTDAFGTQEREIAAAIESLVDTGYLRGERDARGYYQKISLMLEKAKDCFTLVKRMPVAIVRQQQEQLLEQTAASTEGLLGRFCTDQLGRLQNHKALEFAIGDDLPKLEQIILVLQAILKLEKETYLRNFSEAVFHDSKHFQKLEGTIKRILLTYSSESLDEKTILEQYNLFHNPAYILIKGKAKLFYGQESINISPVEGGIAIPSSSLDDISRIELITDTVISVENLTTYHDVSQEQGLILYLGGFHNAPRTRLLQKLYQNNSGVHYYHKGDLDPYGFLILENLKRKTEIPFCTIEMDLETLKNCFAEGHYRALDAADEKAMQSPQLANYSEILRFMREHNCKVEQECFEAMKLGL